MYIIVISLVDSIKNQKLDQNSSVSLNQDHSLITLQAHEEVMKSLLECMKDLRSMRASNTDTSDLEKLAHFQIKDAATSPAPIVIKSPEAKKSVKHVAISPCFVNTKEFSSPKHAFEHVGQKTVSLSAETISEEISEPDSPCEESREAKYDRKLKNLIKLREGIISFSSDGKKVIRRITAEKFATEVSKLGLETYSKRSTNDFSEVLALARYVKNTNEKFQDSNVVNTKSLALELEMLKNRVIDSETLHREEEVLREKQKLVFIFS